VENSKKVLSKERTTGDAAVDGLLSGIVAGLLMIAYLVIAGLLVGEKLSAVFIRFDPSQNGSAMLGLITHLAVSAIYGAIFGVILIVILGRWPSLHRFGWIAGLIYGAILLLLAQAIFFQTVDTPVANITLPNLIIAHLIYGSVLGILVARQR
jgi:hypothetical protein